MRRAVVLLLLACVSAPALAATMYARLSAPVRSGKTLSATTLGSLAQGEPVEVIGREENYYAVTYDGRTGYVYYNKLAEQQPEDVGDLLAGAGTQGIELTELEAGGAMRGLSQTAEDYAMASSIPAWAVQAVESMQARAIEPDDLEAFQREAGLGEYARETAP
jgi:hypothetical protein